MNKEVLKENIIMFAQVSIALAIAYPAFLLVLHYMVVVGEWYHGRGF